MALCVNVWKMYGAFPTTYINWDLSDAGSLMDCSNIVSNLKVALAHGKATFIFHPQHSSHGMFFKQKLMATSCCCEAAVDFYIGMKSYTGRLYPRVTLWFQRALYTSLPFG